MDDIQEDVQFGRRLSLCVRNVFAPLDTPQDVRRGDDSGRDRANEIRYREYLRVVADTGIDYAEHNFKLAAGIKIRSLIQKYMQFKRSTEMPPIAAKWTKQDGRGVPVTILGFSSATVNIRDKFGAVEQTVVKPVALLLAQGEKVIRYVDLKYLEIS